MLFRSNKFNFEKLELIMLAGSPVSAECTNWFYQCIKEDLYVAPGSGGTDICSGFCGPMPGRAGKAGGIQMPHPGVELQGFDEDGNPRAEERRGGEEGEGGDRREEIEREGRAGGGEGERARGEGGGRRQGCGPGVGMGGED